MSLDPVEVKKATLHTWEGATLEVEGGAYLSPEEVLATSTELERLRAHRADALSNKGPAIVLGAALLGLAFGFWLGRRSSDD